MAEFVAAEAKDADAITVTYFDGPGRAELTRLCLSAGGIEFTDNRLTFEEFGAMKADPDSLPMQRFGSMPLLQHGDDLFAQSQACSFYAASLGVSAGNTAKQNAVDLQYSGVHADIQSACYKCLFGSDESKAAGAAALPASAAKFLTAIERMIPAEGFINGRDGPTLADLAVFENATSPYPGLVALGIDLSVYPKLNALVDRVRAVPAVAAYCEKRGF